MGSQYKASTATEIELILQAANFAAKAHARQKRKATSDPYINHLLRVAYSAAQAGFSTEVIIAALLHDVIEDTPVTYEELSRKFPSRVVELVRLLSHWWDDQAPDHVKNAELPKYYAAILKDPDAISLKLMDRADNLNDMAETVNVTPKWAERYLKKSKREMKALLQAPEANPASCRLYQRALDRLTQALERHHQTSEFLDSEKTSH